MSNINQSFRPVNQALLAGLELTSTKIFPLPGATGRRQLNEIDARLSGLAGTTPVGDAVTYYEHIATILHKGPPERYFVAFRETMDAFLARQTDPGKFPEWLMKSPEKQAERSIYIYAMTRHPASVAVMRSIDDWLAHVADVPTFDTLVQFLFNHNVIDAKALRNLQ